MAAINKLAKLAAGFRGTFTVGDDVGIAYEPSPDDADGDGPRVTFQQAVVDLLNAIGPALAEIVASPPTDAPAPCAHLDRAHDGSCFGCGRGANNTNPEATP